MGSSTAAALSRLSLLLLAMLGGAAFGAPPPAWHQLSTPRFQLISQLPEAASREWATEFDQFIDALGTQIKIDPARLPPLTVVIFARPADFTPYRLTQPNGASGDIAGFFASRETWSVIGLPALYNYGVTRQTVFHEGTHWVESAAPVALPLWLSEGLAEVFSTFVRSKDQTYWGTPLDHHVSLLKAGRTIPLAELLAIEPQHSLFNQPDRTRLFYAESWAFVHYLLFGVRSGNARALDRFLDATVNGLPAPAAAVRAFGTDPAGMDRELGAYMGGGSYRTLIRSVPAGSPVAAPYPIAPPDVVETALARLALGSRRYDRVHLHVTNALALTPDQPEPYEILALLRADEDDLDAAVEAARLALHRGSNDAWMHLLAARGRHRQAYDDDTLDAAIAREIADGFARAIALRPNLQAAYVGLARIVEALDPLAPADLGSLLVGHRQFPRDGEILLGLASAAQKRGAPDEAQAILARLMSPNGGFTSDVRERATTLKLHWAMIALHRRIADLIARERLAEALAQYPSLFALPLPPELRSSFTLQRDHLALRLQLAAARDALDEQRPADARRIVLEVLALPRLHPGISAPARRLFEKIEAEAPSPASPP